MLLIQMRSGTFQKRKPFICAGTAELVWRASLRFSYHPKLEAIQSIRHSFDLHGVTVYCQLLTLPILFIESVSPSCQCDKLDNYYFAICTHGPSCESDRPTWAVGVAWLAVEKLSIIAWKVFTPMTSREYFHEISSRFRIINSMPALSPSNSMLVIIGRLSVSAEIIVTATAPLKKDERLHLDGARWPLAGLLRHCVLSAPSSETSRWRGWTKTHVTWEWFHTAEPGQVTLHLPLFRRGALNPGATSLLTPS